jgi:hypothetical protein
MVWQNSAYYTEHVTMAMKYMVKLEHRFLGLPSVLSYSLNERFDGTYSVHRCVAPLE